MTKQTTFFCYTPFTGLGLYNGARGNRWLRNRIKVFKQFVIPSLINQTDRDFVHWISWRPEERGNKYVLELEQYLSALPGYRFVFTYHGIAFWDDKYNDKDAEDRLFTSLFRTLPELMDIVGQSKEVYWLLVPSDDLYFKETVDMVKKTFEKPDVQAVTYTKGYLCNYTTKELLEYNPKTNPPFFAIRFPKEIFLDSGKHMMYTGPYKSHEYIGDKLKLAKFEGRGFTVGTHGENISTHFNHPYGGRKIKGREQEIVFDAFGILDSPPIKIPWSLRKWLLRKLPHKWRRKIRYWWGERFYAKFYEWIRN